MISKNGNKEMLRIRHYSFYLRFPSLDFQCSILHL